MDNETGKDERRTRSGRSISGKGGKRRRYSTDDDSTASASKKKMGNEGEEVPISVQIANLQKALTQKID